MMKSFLQTTEWLKFQEAVGHKTFRFDNELVKANIFKYDLSFSKNYLYIPYGPEVDLNSIQGGLANEMRNFTGQLKSLARENGSMFVKVEPASDTVMELLHEHGFRKSAKQIQPQKTVVLDLNKTEEELLAEMHHKTRYNIKVAEKYGLTTKPSEDVELFWKLLQKTTKRDRFSSHTKEYYKELLDFFPRGGTIRTDLIFACHNERPVAGAIILRYGDTGYYLHGASDYDSRQMMAPHFLHWNMIKYLKGHGSQYYDLWGIDATKWPGVTRFKLGWGGRTIEYPGSFDLPVSGFWYFIYRLARRLF